jgi:serine/threonine protein kinase
MLPLEGQQLGNYDVVKRIRVGGMGAVYEGRQRTAFGRRVAIKVILGDYATDPDMRRRFEREARTIARLHHPNILPLIEFGIEKNVLYLVMPFIDGGTLTSYLRRNLPDLEEISAIYQQLLDAVEYAHDEGLIHRDIKSSNVLLELHRNTPPHVYLADFGLVRTARQAEQEQAGKPIPLDQVPGTPHYMAPEQTLGIITPLTDIYALGVLLYQMLTGELPYNDEDDIKVIQMHLNDPIPSPCDHDVSIPRELEAVVRTAMAKLPEERFQSVAELRAAFLAAMRGSASASSTVEPLTERTRRSVSLQRRASMPLTASEVYERSEEPVALPRRPHQPAPPPAVLELTERRRPRGSRELRATDDFRLRQRVTEEPVKPVARPKPRPAPPTRRHLPRLLYLTVLVPLILLLLILMPRVLGVSFFPAGFPIFGTAPVATVYVTPQSKDFQETYVLTASPQVQTPNPKMHTIPDHVLQATLTDMRTVPTTGVETTPAMQAHGTVVFINRGNDAVTIPAQFVLTTAQGIQVQLTQAVLVPPQMNGQPGSATALAVAVAPGASGNIAALALDGPCCNNHISVENPVAFTGGADAQAVHVVTQADLGLAKSAALAALQHQITQQLQKQLYAGEALVGQLVTSASVSATPSVGAQADQVQVVTVLHVTAIAYNPAMANHMTLELLNQTAIQTLGAAYQLQGTPVILSTHVESQQANGLAFLDISARGTWVYVFTEQEIEQWRQMIKGATRDAALAYLNTQIGVGAVQIRLPFGSDHLPTSVDEIKIISIIPAP